MSTLRRTFLAVNPPGAANPVHDDAFARTLGFERGLVPGVDLYACLAALPAETWGAAWVAGGTMSARFLKPVYDRQQVLCSAEPTGVGALALELRNPDGEVCVAGSARLRDADGPVSVSSYPEAPAPARRGPPAYVAGQVLSTLRTPLELRDHAWPARLGNDVLTYGAELPPWMHVESRVRHLAAPRDGEDVAVRGLVAEVFERRGHRFVDVDLLVLSAAGRPLAQLRHVAIYGLAQLR